MRGDFTCKGCEDRYPGYHDHCVKYQFAKEKRLNDRRKEIMANIRPTGILKHYTTNINKFSRKSK